MYTRPRRYRSKYPGDTVDKLNAQFKKDPISFMSVHPIDIPAESKLTKEAPKTGIYEFDLRNGTLGEVLLDLMADRGKAVGKNTHVIEAYWLPWQSGGSTTMKLEREADFFFTSALAGCRIQVFPGETPIVAHVAGDQEGSKWREKQAEKVMGDNYSRSRAFSSTKHYGKDGFAFFVGFWSAEMKRWKFVGQVMEVDEKTNQRSVGKLINQGSGLIEF